MAAQVETMFSVREKPWHGLGTIVAEAPDSETALRLAGLDWNVIPQDIWTVFSNTPMREKSGIAFMRIHWMSSESWRRRLR